MRLPALDVSPWRGQYGTDESSHGDLLFLSYKPLGMDGQSHPTTEASSSTTQPSQPDTSHPHIHTNPPLPDTIPLVDLSKVEEPEVDVYWSGRDGKIERKIDPTFCRHRENGMCDYCMPLEVSERLIFNESRAGEIALRSD